MCLLIDHSKHNFDCQNYYEPKTIRLSKKVYKMLYIVSIYNNTYYTPYQGVTVKFKDEKAVLEAPTMMDHYRNNWGMVVVEIGIHAFYKKDTALAKLASLQDESYAIFEAIIPAGTKYFYGVGGEIVSEKLIIKNKIVK